MTNDIEVAEEVLHRLRNGFIVTRSHIRSIGDIAQKYNVYRANREDYIKYLTRLVKAVKEEHKA